jgi:DNA-binding transcriptional regulator YiaG
LLDDNKKTVSAWIRSNRVRLNLSPYHLATKLGISAGLIRSWEEGKCAPTPGQIAELGAIMGNEFIRENRAG